MKRKRIAIILTIISIVYLASYCTLRLSKILVHQEVALIYREPPTPRKQTAEYQPAICYTIHHDIGHGSYVDQDNYNEIIPAPNAVSIAKCFYFPLIKLETAYWSNTKPKAIYETICSQ